LENSASLTKTKQLKKNKKNKNFFARNFDKLGYSVHNKQASAEKSS